MRAFFLVLDLLELTQTSLHVFECLEREQRVTSDAISLNRLHKYHQQFTSSLFWSRRLGLRARTIAITDITLFPAPRGDNCVRSMSMFGYDWVRNKNFCLAMNNLSAAYSTTTIKYLFQYLKRIRMATRSNPFSNFRQIEVSSQLPMKTRHLAKSLF